MARRRTNVGQQVKARAGQAQKKEPEPEEERPPLVSTGSTLLDLAISGGRWRGGGIPPGILVEIFGPASAGKTVILCELAGAVRREGGEIMFRDPEARLNKEFAKLFDLQVDEIDYDIPSTIPEVFGPVQKWEADDSKIRAAFADSLAALTTDMELEGKDGYGGRRAKEFSEQCRLTTRALAQNNTLMVCSNQVRQNLDAGPWGQKYKSPGGESIGFYASLRLRAKGSQKLTKKKKIKGKEVARSIGTETEFEVHKSSIWKPYRTATVYIIHDYGIDDIRANLEFVKKTKGDSRFKIGGTDLGQGMEAAIEKVEEDELEEDLRDETIDLWWEVESKFNQERKKKKRR